MRCCYPQDSFNPLNIKAIIQVLLLISFLFGRGGAVGKEL